MRGSVVNKRDCRFIYLRRMNHIQVMIETETEEQKEVVIALLSEEGFEGFEEMPDSVKAYIKEDDFDEKTLQSITESLHLEYKKMVIPQQNWNALWESNFQPVAVDDFVAIRADFHEPVKNVVHEIVITPKMSFGTGHHATTYMMMQQMRDLDFAGKSVFDFGTGTGILAILAEKLGAENVFAVDNDEWCIDNASENIERNNCKKINLKQDDKVEVDAKLYDIVLANINKNIILNNMNSLILSLRKDGILLLSGLLIEDEADILHVAKKYNIIHRATKTKDKWICLLFNG